MGVIPDYSYKIAKSSQYTKLRARIRNGVIETEQADELRLPEFAWFENNRGEALFYKGRLRLRVDADGRIKGILGGYRDWRDVYGKDTFDTSSSAGTRETYYRENQIGKYYSFKRNADGIRDPKTGKNIGISAAYRVTAVPAYVVDPEKPARINEPLTSNVPGTYRAMFLKAEMTKAIIPDPVRKKGADEEDTDVKDTSPEPKSSKSDVVANNGLPQVSP